MSIDGFSFIPKSLREWQTFFNESRVTPDDGTITDETFGNRSARSVIGRPEATDGKPSDIVAGADGHVLTRRSGVVQFDGLTDSDIPSGIARDTEVAAGDAAVTAGANAALASHVADADPHTGYQKESEKNSASGYAGLNASSRTTKGVDTTDDLVIDLATKGLVLRDTQGTPHYWRVTISNVGAIVTTDLGTTKP